MKLVGIVVLWLCLAAVLPAAAQLGGGQVTTKKSWLKLKPLLPAGLDVMTAHPLDISPKVGAAVTYEGRIVRFETSFNEATGAIDCQADVSTGDGKGFTVLFGTQPEARGSDPEAEALLFRQTAACLAARQAYLKGFTVSVNGLIERLGSEGGELGAVRPVTFTLSSEISAGPSSEPAASCETNCLIQGLVTKITYYLRDGFLCSATAKIQQTEGVFQEATLPVKFPESLRQYRWITEWQTRQLMQAKLQSCQILEAAAGTDKPVRAEVSGQGANRVSSNLRMEDSPPPDLDSLF